MAGLNLLDPLLTLQGLERGQEVDVPSIDPADGPVKVLGEDAERFWLLVASANNSVNWFLWPKSQKPITQYGMNPETGRTWLFVSNIVMPGLAQSEWFIETGVSASAFHILTGRVPG